MESISIGLDIGSSAVRAAEMSMGREGPVLHRYAQVGMPPGAMVDGEVINPSAVTAALRRLWTEGGFSSNKVVLGVSGHRVIVRQADVPALDEEDLRSALRFDAQELIPIPMENASFDFRVLNHGDGPGADGKSTMRILLVAAHRDLLRAHLDALKGAGLEARVIEPTPLSLMRVIPDAGPGANGDGGVDVIVAIGAELTTVAVRQGGIPRFIRSLSVGGAKLTAGIVSAIHVDALVAERIKRNGAIGDGIQMAQVQRAITTELRDLAEEVRATVDFFAAQTDGAVIERMLITGGAAETQGLAEVLAGTSPLIIQRVDPFATVRVDDLGLSHEDVNRARATAATAVGLALWPVESEGSRLTILPSDVAEARRNRRITMLAATGIAGLAALLGVVGVAQNLTVHNAQDQVNAAKHQAAVLQSTVTGLESKTAVHNQMLSRQSLAVTALTGDIDWVRVLNQVFKELPPGETVTGLAGGRTLTTPNNSSTAPATPGVGTMSFSISGPGGLPAASAWLDALQKDPDFEGTWVQGISVTENGGTLTFTSNTNLTKHAQSTRAKADPKMTTHVRRIFAVAAVAAVVVVVAWYLLLWSPQSKKLTHAHAAKATADAQVGQLDTQVTQLQSLLKEIPSDAARLKVLEAALPNNPALDSALRDLHDTAVATGATVLSVSPSVPNGSAASTGSTSGGGQATPGGPAVTMQIAATGTYAQLEAFLSQLTNLAQTQRIFVVDHIAIGGSTTAQATFTTRVFYAGQPTP